MSHLIMFTDHDCDLCQQAYAAVAKVEMKFQQQIEKKFPYNTEADFRVMEGYQGTEPCEGLPFFVNTQTGATLCGEVSFKSLRHWAQGNSDNTE